VPGQKNQNEITMSKSIYKLARDLRKNQTPAEVYFWNRVRKKRILGCIFLRQFVIEYPNKLNKRSFFITDFYCAKIKLIVEIDGEIHRHQLDYDEFRESTLNDLNYTVIRFKNFEVLNNWNEVAEKLKSKILELESKLM